jgi:hypothetical protein
MNNPGFDTRQRQGISTFSAMSRQSLVPNQHPIQWTLVGSFLKVKWPVHVNHVLPSSAEVKNAWGYTSISLTKPSRQEQEWEQLYLSLLTQNSQMFNCRGSHLQDYMFLQQC